MADYMLKYWEEFWMGILKWLCTFFSSYYEDSMLLSFHDNRWSFGWHAE